jgi:hypothetical protein
VVSLQALARQPPVSPSYHGLTGPIAAGALAAVVWALPHTSHACSCSLPLPPAAAAERADAVFEARVEAVAADASSPDSFVGLVRYDLEVLRVWKGELGPVAQVSTRASGVACGRSLTIGKVYILYASKREDGELTDTMCSRTRLVSTADEDLAVLGPGASPLGGQPATEPTTREPPRIAPPPPDLGGPPPVTKSGCAVVSDPVGFAWGPVGPTPGLGLCVLAVLWWTRPRRSFTVDRA